MFATFKQIFAPRNKELRKRILFTLCCLAIFIIGTTISTIAIPMWNQPRIIYKYVFKVSLKEYFRKYVVYTVIAIFAGIMTTYTCNALIQTTTFISLIGRGIICMTIPNILYFFIFLKTNEMEYISNIVKYKFIKSNITKNVDYNKNSI